MQVFLGLCAWWTERYGEGRRGDEGGLDGRGGIVAGRSVENRGKGSCSHVKVKWLLAAGDPVTTCVKPGKVKKLSSWVNFLMSLRWGDSC
ncbi:hypothetical protein GCM10017688_41020 [Streptomyces ramulosus]